MVMLSPKDIRDLRIALGLTGPEFAERVGVTEDAVWKWERGARHPNYARMLRLNELRNEVIEKALHPV
jgi:DNA-binding transcriptional regulator YiaG